MSEVSKVPLVKYHLSWIYTINGMLEEHWMDNLGPDIYSEDEGSQAENMAHIGTNSRMVILIPYTFKTIKPMDGFQEI